MSTIVLAYSGGLDTSVLLKKYILEGHQVIAMTLDLGESDGTPGAGASAALEAVRDKAIALGAKDGAADRRSRTFHHGVRVAGAARERNVPRGVSALCRPLAAADRRAAGGDGPALPRRCRRARLHRQRQRSGPHRDRGPRARPVAHVLAPLRDQPLSRPDAIAFASEHASDLLDGGEAVLDRRQSVGPLDRGRRPRRPLGGAARGRVRLDGAARRRVPPHPKRSSSISIAASRRRRQDTARTSSGYMNERAGAHGVGRIDLVEDRVVGPEVARSVRVPGLDRAHRAHTRRSSGWCSPATSCASKPGSIGKYAEIAYEACGLRRCAARSTHSTLSLAERMTGRVRLRLHKARPSPPAAVAVLDLSREDGDVRARATNSRTTPRPGSSRCGGCRVERAAAVRRSATRMSAHDRVSEAGALQWGGRFSAAA